MKSNIDKVYSKLPNKKHNFRKQKVDLSKLDDLHDRRDSWTSKLRVKYYRACWN